MPYALKRPRLYYERRGSGEPLLWITGFTISSAVFDPILGLYEDRFDCITYDNRGSGRSDAPPLPTSMPQLAGDAVSLMDALGLESAHVYGFSMGGMIAQEVAMRFPDRVRGLILGCSTPGGPRAIRPARAELRAMGSGAARALGQPGRPWLAPLLFSDSFRREHPERVHELLRHFGEHRPAAHGVLGHWWASVYHDTVSRLGEIQAPTLVLHGELDAMAPLDNARLLAEHIPDAELAIVPGVGHAYALEAPERSRTLVTEWFDRRSPIPAGRPREGIGARLEPVTRSLGLPIGAARTGRSLVGLAADRVTRRGGGKR